MDFLKNMYDYFRGTNTKRDEDNFIPSGENHGSHIPEEVPRVEMDTELPPDFIFNNFRGRKPFDDNRPNFHLRENSPFFGDFSSLFQMIGQFGEAMREIDRQFGDLNQFHNFPEGIFGDMTNGMIEEPEKRLTGEDLRNYYLNGNNVDTHQGENRIVTLNDKEFDDHQGDLIISNNNNRSDFTITPHFKSRSRVVTTKVGPDGVAEITTVVTDESGNEERTVRRVKLF